MPDELPGEVWAMCPHTPELVVQGREESLRMEACGLMVVGGSSSNE